MSKKAYGLVGAVVLAAAIALPTVATATNGYFPHGQGTRAKAMAGAGVAFPQDSIAAATNPAGTVVVGEQLDAGAGVFMPNRSYSYDGPSPFIDNAAQDSDSNSFVIPHFGMNWSLDDTSAVGLAVYAAGGMNTDYPNPVYADASAQAGRTGVNLAQLFVSGSYAMDLGGLQLGGAVILAYQTFSAEGLQGFDNDFYSANAGSVTNNGDDTSTGFGIRIGAIFEASDGFKIGASYQPMIDMEPFSKYSGLFAENGDFDIPSTYSVGVAWEATEKITIAADYQAINYTDVAAVSNPGETLIDASGGFPLPATSDNRLGGANGMGFGWQDIATLKIGVAWQMNTDWILRGGFSQGDNPIPADATFFNILAPGVIEQHVTAGFTMSLSEGGELSFAYMHALEGSTTGTLPADIGGGTNTITMDQNEVELSYGKKF